MSDDPENSKPMAQVQCEPAQPPSRQHFGDRGYREARAVML